MLPRQKTGTTTLARAAVAFGLALVSAIAVADDSDLSFPYQAIVLKTNAPIRSGPGSVHYATDKLEQGSPVEVYRHDPGGWCAVRPPRGSFSLVPSAAIKVTADNVGEVIEPNTQAWVGTRLGAVETPLWQVKMRKNEPVEILGEVSWPHPEGHSTIWYQIAPPAGEFRWMQISDLQLPPSKRSTPPTQASSIAISDPQSSQAPDRNRRVSAEARLNTTNDRSTGVRTASLQQIVPPVNRQRPSDFASQASPVRPLTNDGTTNTDPQNLGWRRSTRPIPASDSAALAGEFSDQDSHIRTASNGDRNRSWSSEQSYDSRSSSANQAAAPPTDRFASLADPRGFRADRRSSFSNAQLDARPGAGRSFALSGQSIEQLELELTNQLLQQPQTWQLTPILSAAESLYRSAPTAIDQQRAARLIEKCQNGQRLQAGFSTAESSVGANTLPFGKDASGPQRSAGLSSSSGAIGIGVSQDASQQSVSFGTTYDAFGWLNELVREQGALDPTYVLQNANGKITHHVTAAPGLNLHRYVKSRIGIIGQRGYDHRLKLDHVIASRVVVLDQAR